MSSRAPEDSMKRLFQRHIPLSPAQIGRLAHASSAMLLAKDSRLSQIACWINQPISKAGRVQFLNRLLDAAFMRQEYVYQPFVRGSLNGLQQRLWHVVIDRSTWHGYQTDVLMIALAYHGHALPLVWQVMDFGCTSAAEQLQLWQRVLPLIPPSQAVLVHGDTEFGSVEVMHYLRQQGWHFIFGQPNNTRYCLPDQSMWLLLRDLPVTPRHPVYLHNIVWTESHRYRPLNLFAFYDPHQASPESPRREIRYCATSLPIAPTLRQLGSRRWGIECLFKDCKSAGFELEKSDLAHGQRCDSLLTLLSLTYVWVNCVGRWLCKTGQRRQVDAGTTRHLSLFRIGHDWLVSQFRQQRQWPLISTLYS